ncbi:hypothetical protein [Streptomyces sp. NPDC002535]
MTTSDLDRLGDLPRADSPVELGLARRLARETVNEQANASIHDHHQILRAAVALDLRLRDLLDALDAEEGR